MADMNRKLFKISAVVGIVILFIVAGIYAKTAPDVIPLQDPAYKEHKKGVVQFEHKKHWDDYSKKYPEFYKNGCGECHHDENNKPLSELKDGDDVQKCIECHKIAAEMPKKEKRAVKKDMRAKKISEKEGKSKIYAYHAEALHENCKGCHRKYNKQHKPKKKAPTSCTKCHPRKAK